MIAPKLTVNVNIAGVEPVSKLIEATGNLVKVVGELAAKHIYLDPHDAAEDSWARSCCALCMRYGLRYDAIDHAESCVVGQLVRRVADVNSLLVRIANDGKSPEAVAANAVRERRSYALEANDETKERGIVYFADPFERMKTFNPYSNPCPAAMGGAICQLERGHAGAHCSGAGTVWADEQEGVA